jgi:maleate isomerase
MSDAPNPFVDIEPARRIRLGMLTPSSNTVVEPVCARMLAGAPEITAHFQRFRVTAIRAGAEADRQFALEPMLGAAELLADAQMNSISWNGTSASWLGLDRDRELCAAITKATGVPATTASLAAYEALALSGVRKVGLVTPYVPEILDAITAQLEANGYRVVSALGLGLTDNYQIAKVRTAQLVEMIRAAAKAGSEAILVQCTNLAGAALVETLERETGALIFDSVAVTLWGALRCAGVDPRILSGWGRLFREFA